MQCEYARQSLPFYLSQLNLKPRMRQRRGTPSLDFAMLQQSTPGCLGIVASCTTLPRRPPTISPTSSLGLLLLLRDLHDIDTDRIEAHALEKVLGVAVDVQLSTLRVLREVQGRDLGHVLIFSFTLLFLQFEGNSTHGAALDALHEMGGVAGNLVKG
jgi:hypothetical protein